MFLPNRLAVAIACSLATLPASAADYYLGARASFDDVSDVEIDAGPILGDLTLDRGWGLAGVAGRKMGDNWRLEIDAALRRADAEDLPTLGLEGLSGRVDVRTVMLNAVADLPIDGSSVVPYVGAGAGWAAVKVDNIDSGFLRISGEDNSAWGAQVFAGIAMPLSKTLTMTVDARYNYVRAGGVSYDIAPDASFESDARVKTLSLVAGLRFDL